MSTTKGTTATKAAAKRAPRTRPGAKRSTAKRSTAKRATTKRAAAKRTTKDPAGGLTAAGRAHFARTEGAKLRPGVRGAADTPDKMRRKGSFLRRHFANPQGPMVDDAGEPTRLALSAHAWGEPVPKTTADAHRLAEKGARLLARYAATKARTGGAKRSSTQKTRS